MITKISPRLYASFVSVVAVAMALCPIKMWAQAYGGGDVDALQLPLPAVPAELTQPADRAAFVMMHFWDAMDFSDETIIPDTLFLELNFVNFVSLFPHATQEAREQATDALLSRAAPHIPLLRRLNETAEKYLADPGSPMRNEEFFILYLERLLATPGIPGDELLRPRSLLATAVKNRVGTQAADFRYLTREGSEGTLLATQAELLLLVFYDPACPHCSEILEELNDSRLLHTLIEEGSLSVLAVYTEGDRELWDKTKAGMPSAWGVAIDQSDVVQGNVYDLPAMPVIYLLDRDKTVLLKDPTPAQLFAYPALMGD